MLSSYDKAIIQYIKKTMSLADDFNDRNKNTAENEDDVTRIELVTLNYNPSVYSDSSKKLTQSKNQIKMDVFYPYTYQSDKLVMITYPYRMVQKVEKFAKQHGGKVKLNMNHENAEEREMFTMKMQTRGSTDNGVLAEMTYRIMKEVFEVNPKLEHLNRNFMIKNLENIKQYRQIGGRINNMLTQLQKKGIYVKKDQNYTDSHIHKKLKKKDIMGYFFYNRTSLNKLLSQIIKDKSELKLEGGWGATSGSNPDKIKKIIVSTARKCGLRIYDSDDKKIILEK